MELSVVSQTLGYLTEVRHLREREEQIYKDAPDKLCLVKKSSRR